MNVQFFKKKIVSAEHRGQEDITLDQLHGFKVVLSWVL